jgi:signal transduction histidine kinase
VPLLRANSTAVKRAGQRTLLAFVVILGLAGFAIVQSSSNVMRAEIQSVNAADLDLLSELYAQDGLSAVIDLIDVSTQRQFGRRAVFGAFTLEGGYLAGDLTKEPDLAQSNEIFLTHAAGDTGTAYLALKRTFPDAVLYVGRPSGIIDSTVRNFLLILPLAFLAILAVFILFLRAASGTMGGLLDRFQETLKAFSAGDHTARIPLGPHVDDRFHDVSLGINANLARADEATRVLENTTIAIAHDLRTPLTRASLAVQMAQTSKGIDPETGEKLHTASEEMAKLSQTFDTILRISNISASNGKANFSTFDLSALMHEIAESYVPVFEDARFELRAPETDGPALIRADKSMVAQLVINLLTNVMRHCPEGTVAQMAVARAGTSIVLTVADNGPGVPPDKLAWIFAPFTRVDESRSKAGTGLGLALVHAIALRNMATITARTCDPGLAFDVTFPAADA